MKKLINLQPSRPLRWFLGVLPFVLLLVLYLSASEARLAENPNDKLLPALSSFADAIQRMKMEIEIHAPCDGVVIKILREAGQQVAAGQALALIERSGKP